jgi:anti-sigma factor RsiW
MTHPPKDRLRSYCAGKLPEYQATPLEQHLAACDDCSAFVRRLYSLDSVLEHHTARRHGQAYRLQEAAQAIERSGAFAAMAERTRDLVRGAVERGALEIRQLAADRILPMISAGLYAAVAPVQRFQAAVYQLHEFQRLEAVQLMSAAEREGEAIKSLPVMVAPEGGGEYTVLSMTPGTALVITDDQLATVYALEEDRAQNCWTRTISLPAQALVLILPLQ